MAPKKHAFPVRYPGESEDRFGKRVRRNYIDLPEAYHLHRIQWQISGCLTHRRDLSNFPKVAHKIGRSQFLATIRKASRQIRGVYFPSLFIAARHEKGTLEDRPDHIHFLIARLPTHVDPVKFAKLCETNWLSLRGGRCKVERYDPILDGAGYIAKAPKSGLGAIGDESGLTFSDALINYLKSIGRRERGI